MDYKDWLMIKYLSQNKNITKTAKSMFISQPAITKRLFQLEQDLGIEIAIRNRNMFEFTPEGLLLVEYSNDMLLKYEQLQNKLLQQKNQVAGILRIAVSGYVSKYILPHFLKSFKTKYPLVEFMIITDWNSEVIKRITNNEVHVGIVRGDYNWTGGKIELEEDYLCIASSSPLELQNLPDYQRIVFKTDSNFESQINNWWKENYTKPSNTVIKVDQSDTCKEMIRHDLGYGIVTQQMIKDSKELCIYPMLDQNQKTLKRNTWLYYNKSIENMKLIHAFLEFTQSYF